MIRRQAFRFALRPSDTQERLFRQFAGACRFVHNRALALEIDRHASGEVHLGYVGTANLLPLWKRDPLPDSSTGSEGFGSGLPELLRETGWLSEVPQEGLERCLPVPTGRDARRTQRQIRLPKIGWVRYHKSRTVLGTIKNVTVRRSGDRRFVSIQTEREIEVPVHPNPRIVGLYLGVARFATLSDGTVIAPGRFLSRYERQLKRLHAPLPARKRARRTGKKSERSWPGFTAKSPTRGTTSSTRSRRRSAKATRSSWSKT